MKVEIKKFPPRLVASIHHVGPYMECGPVWETLCSGMIAAGIYEQNAVAISICHDNPDITPPEQCRMDVCIALPQDLNSIAPETQEQLQQNDIQPLMIGSEHPYLSVTVTGPYSLLHPAYRAIYEQWFPENGYQPAHAPCLEIYHNSPQDTPPEALKTEILIPLAARSEQ